MTESTNADIIVSAVGFLTSAGFAWVFSGIIVCLFVVFIGLLWWNRNKVKKELDAAAKVVGKINNDQEELFAESYEQINRELSTSEKFPIISHYWREFSENLILPHVSKKKVICNTRDPQTYFNTRTIIDSHLHVRSINSVPNLLIGLGILGTFLGLMGGVYGVKNLLASEDSSEIIDGLGQLLSGAGLAFVTSVIGIFCSIFYQFVDGPIIRGLSKRLEAFVIKIDSCLKRVTREQYAALELRELTLQSELLSTFNTDLAVSIASALDERMGQRLSPALEKLVEVMEGVRTDRDQTSQKVLERIVTEFKESISGAAGREMRDMGQSLQTLNKVLVGSTDEISKKMESAGKGAAEAISRAAQSFESGVQSLTSATEKASLTLLAFKDSMSDMEKMNRTVQNAHVALDQTMQRLVETSQFLESSVVRADSTLEHSATLAKQLQATSQEGQSLNQALQEAWEQYRDRFEKVDESLGRTIQQIIEGVNAYTDRVQQFSSELDKHMSTGISKLSTVISEFSDVVDEFQQKSESAQG